MGMLRPACAVPAAALLAACAAGSAPPPRLPDRAPDEVVASGWIDQQGGFLEVADPSSPYRGARVMFPPGAVDRPTEILLAATADPLFPLGLKLGPGERPFAVPVTVTAPWATRAEHRSQTSPLVEPAPAPAAAAPAPPAEADTAPPAAPPRVSDPVPDARVAELQRLIAARDEEIAALRGAADELESRRAAAGAPPPAMAPPPPEPSPPVPLAGGGRRAELEARLAAQQQEIADLEKLIEALDRQETR